MFIEPSSRRRWFWTPAIVVTTFSVVLLMRRDDPRPSYEQEIRPVVARAPSKPFVTPKEPNPQRPFDLPAPPVIAANAPPFALASVTPNERQWQIDVEGHLQKSILPGLWQPVEVNGNGGRLTTVQVFSSKGVEVTDEAGKHWVSTDSGQHWTQK